MGEGAGGDVHGGIFRRASFPILRRARFPILRLASLSFSDLGVCRFETYFCILRPPQIGESVGNIYNWRFLRLASWSFSDLRVCVFQTSEFSKFQTC